MAKGPTTLKQPRLVEEERTLEALESLPSHARAIALPVYLVASFWPWWVTLLVPAAILWQLFPGVRAFAWAAAALAILSVAGYLGKGLIERLAPGWAASTK